ncbi:DUF6056 family protein, partial [Proteus terrae]|uniref:DUF6056 family protein n=1 Tax=Proteus terrae TaxID=1574161 RepID=UPI001F25812B
MIKFLYSSLYVLFFMCFFSVAFFTPMHSDDYTYYTFGFDPEIHLAHYIRWSGRVVSDYISPFILSFSNNIIISLFTSIAATLLIFTISLIARSGNKITYNDCLISLYVFLLYWLSNTNLGQTTFWVVGTANYLWTSLFILLFIYRILNNKNFSILTLILAFISSCSNENSGYIPFLLCLYLLIIEFYNHKKINKTILIYSIISLIGFLILILAPGNYFRASLYPDWYSKPIYEKLFIHFIDRVPMILSSLWLTFCSFSIISIFGDCNKNTKKNTSIIIFLLFSALSLTALFAAPSYQSRSANIVLIFLLCAISIFISQLSFKKINQKISLFIIFSYILIVFITSYTLI